jgi:hypothetical protein
MSPQITPGYWICPRCDSRDTYFAPRVVGQVGMARPFEIGNVDMAGGVARNVEKDVALCKECGERSKWVPEVRIYSSEEQKRMSKGWSIASITFGIPVGIFTIKMSEFGWAAEGYFLMFLSACFCLGGVIGLRNASK